MAQTLQMAHCSSVLGAMDYWPIDLFCLPIMVINDFYKTCGLLFGPFAKNTVILDTKVTSGLYHRKMQILCFRFPGIIK